MKLGIMQPYFFPYIGYFQLMNYVDEWMMFDQIQFIDKGWINRNRILHPNPDKVWQFITVPLAKRGQFDQINDISIAQDQLWLDTIMDKLTRYKKAPFYQATTEFVYHSLVDSPASLSAMLEKTLIATARYLNITTPITTQSKLNMPLPEINHAGQWALEIAKIRQADCYINPIGGSSIFRQDEFDDANIQLEFMQTRLTPYVQRIGHFVEGLSIIDVMMWNDHDTIQHRLNNDFSILTKQQGEHE